MSPAAFLKMFSFKIQRLLLLSYIYLSIRAHRPCGLFAVTRNQCACYTKSCDFSLCPCHYPYGQQRMLLMKSLPVLKCLFFVTSRKTWFGASANQSSHPSSPESEDRGGCLRWHIVNLRRRLNEQVTTAAVRLPQGAGHQLQLTSSE